VEVLIVVPSAGQICRAYVLKVNLGYWFAVLYTLLKEKAEIDAIVPFIEVSR